MHPTEDPVSDLTIRLPRALTRGRAWLPWIGFVLACVLVAVLVPFGFVRVSTLDAPPLGWAQWASGLGVALATLVVLPLRVRPRHLAAVGLGAAVVVSAVSVAVLAARPPASALWPAITYPELLGLALLALLAIRRCRGWHAAAVVAAAIVATASAPLLRGPADVVEMYLAVLLMVAAVSTGLFLRVLAAARAQQLAQARREERLALARDVHDTVAHHMTGVIVQAQAARHVAERDPAAAMRALSHIEQASTEALTAMRLVVATLREDNTPAPREPTQLRAALHQLAGAVGHPHVHLALHHDSNSNTTLPPEVSSTVLRIARESLTNARRHAHASHVDVHTQLEQEHVTLDITDDGRAEPPPAQAQGYGLAGLAERVDLLGGDFAAGPSENGGWRVHARLPLRQEPR